MRSKFSYASQLWAPQSVNLIQLMERIQRRATKCILQLPFRTKVSYKQRLLKLGLLPLTYWLELHDMVFLFRILKGEVFISSNDVIKHKEIRRSTRQNDSALSGLILEVPFCKTVSLQNSYFVRSIRIWNILPNELKDLSQSTGSFKFNLRTKYWNLLSNVYDPDNALTYKSVCPKCHQCRPLENITVKPCCY